MGADAIVIGGGFAGISTAVSLTEAGLRVLLVEKRPFLGGRAYAVRDRVTGDWVDNGQHAMMGCYHGTLSLLEKIGTISGIGFQDSLQIVYRGANGFYDRLQCPPLPGPFHLLAGLLRMRSFGLRDLPAAIRFGLAARKYQSLKTEETVSELCGRLRQTEALKQMMWDPITLSALNESPETADAGLLCAVLAQAFMGKTKDSRMGLPIVPLQSLHGDFAEQFLEDRGGGVVLGKSVERLIVADGNVKQVVLASGERLPCGYCVAAVPHSALRAILQRSGLWETVPAPDLGASPIVSVYLWYRQAVGEETVCCLQGTTFEWAFHRSNFMNAGVHQYHCVCLVVSAARRMQYWSRQELIQSAIDDMQTVYPETRSLKPYSSMVFREPHATFSATPAQVRRRPGHETALKNFSLAGDWTNTGLPATIESAVQSGKRCAELIARTS